VLLSSDLGLCWENLVAYYPLRFQIEFNLRDAKQFWGLQDCMNQKQRPVTNAANLAFFMVNISMVNIWHALLGEFGQLQPQASQAGVLDLKASWRGRRYAQATLKLLPQPPAPVFMEQIIQQVACYGAIHTQSCSLPAT
jgi:putative transposase